MSSLKYRMNLFFLKKTREDIIFVIQQLENTDLQDT